MRIALISVAAALLLPIDAAQAEPYYLISASDSGDLADFVDAKTISRKSGNTYDFDLLRVYNGPGIQANVKYSIGRMSLDCDRSEISIIKLDNYAVDRTLINSASGESVAPIRVQPNSFGYDTLQFICAGATRDLSFSDRKIPEGVDPIAITDMAYKAPADG